MREPIKDVAATLLLPERKSATFITEVSAAINDHLCALGHVVHNISASGRHLARFDLAGAQIVVAYCGAPVTPAEYRRYLRPAKRDSFSDDEALAQLSIHRSCLILSAKPKALPGYPAPSLTEIEALMHQLITGLHQTINIRLVLWGQTGILYTEGEFAEVVARSAAAKPPTPIRAMATTAVTTADEEPAPLADLFAESDLQDAMAEPAPVPRIADTVASESPVADSTGPGLFAQNVMDICRLHDRLDGNLAQIRRIRPNPPRPREAAPFTNADFEPMVVANDTPDLPSPKASQAERIRKALYPDEVATQPALSPRDRPLEHRLAIYTLNTTLLVISLPVGAAMLTYNALGRESLTNTARAMAITGVGIFYSQLPIAQKLLALVM